MNMAPVAQFDASDRTHELLGLLMETAREKLNNKTMCKQFMVFVFIKTQSLILFKD